MKITRGNNSVKVGVAKVKPIMQLESLECGASCLAMILAYYNKYIPIEKIRSDCGVSRDGSNAKNILLASKAYGLTAKAYKCNANQLKTLGAFPCILYWNNNHFVVLCGFKGGNAIINDPARGRIRVGFGELSNCFSGVAISFERGNTFTASGKRENLNRQIKDSISKVKTGMSYLAVLSILMTMILISLPALLRFYTDEIINNPNINLEKPFLIVLSAVLLLLSIVMLLIRFNKNKVEAKMDIVKSSQYFYKLLGLPYEFFVQRMPADLYQRAGLNSKISNTTVRVLLPLMVNVFGVILYVLVMSTYSLSLTAVGLLGFVLNIVSANMFLSTKSNLTSGQMRDLGRLKGKSLSGIEMMDNIKASGREHDYFNEWSQHLSSANNTKLRLVRLNGITQMVSQIMMIFTCSAMVFMAISLNNSKGFTIGAILAFAIYFIMLITPSINLVDNIRLLKENASHIERVGDVLNYKEKNLFSGNESQAERQKLTGDIEIKNITFGYSKLLPPLIENLSLTIKRGSKVALIGDSGSGKSTISRLISGLVVPWEGEIRFDGKAMSEIEKSVFNGSVAVVDQEITLFRDSIANNVKMWDESVEEFEVLLACRDAEMHNEIIKRDGGYDYELSENGKDFSGGERQRLEIARVLTADPTILVLDEATSALDSHTEQKVITAISNRGLTCIMIAHRLSTIRDADQIVVMRKGKIVDIGKHEELMETSSYYNELVNAD